MANLKRGSTGRAVRTLQEGLKALGHYAGKVDGDFGTRTEKAVRAFQTARGLPVDGVAGPDTMRVIEAAGQPAPAPPAVVYRIGSRGQEVRALQEGLAARGFYRGRIDGDFGGGTQAAVKAFQRSRGLATDGEVRAETWQEIFQEAIPRPAVLGLPLNERCLALTGTFESNKSHPDYFASLSGDFDGQGISFGVLQWNFGQGSLQRLLGDLLERHPDVMREVFQTHRDTLVEALEADKAELMGFARSIQHPVRHFVFQPWQGMFKALGRTAECQALQVQYADALYREALAMCDEYALWSERAVALMFDIKTQNGSIQRVVAARIRAAFEDIPDSATRDTREVACMRAVANLRAEAANPRWVEDVRARKLCCANGEGLVHGVSFQLADQFGIGLTAR